MVLFGDNVKKWDIVKDALVVIGEFIIDAEFGLHYTPVGSMKWVPTIANVTRTRVLHL